MNQLKMKTLFFAILALTCVAPLAGQEKPKVQSLKMKKSMSVLRWSVSESGKTIVAWCGEFRDLQSAMRQQNIDSQLLIIDAEKMEVKKTQPLVKPIVDLATNDSHVFLFPASSQIVYRMKLDDPSDRKKTLLSGMVSTADCDSQNRLFIRMRDGRTVYVCDAETLKVDGKDPRNYDTSRLPLYRRYNPPYPDNVRQFKDVQLGERLYFNAKQKQVVGLARRLLMYPTFQFDQSPLSTITKYASYNPWARTVIGGRLVDDGETQIDVCPSSSAISRDFPVLVSLSPSQNSQRSRSASIQILYRDLDTGDSLADFDFFDSNAVNLGHRFSLPFQVELRGKQVFATDGWSIHKTTIPKDVITQASKTMYFQVPNQPLVDLNKKHQIKFAVANAEKVRFELLTKISHVTVDKSTGVVSIDGPALWKKFQEDMKKSASHVSQEDSYCWPQTINIENERRIAEFLKVPADKQPINLPIVIQAKNEDGYRAVLSYNLIALATTEKSFFLASLVQKRTATLQNYRKELKARSEVERRRRYGQSEVSASERRLQNLSLQFKAMERELNEVIEMIDNYEKKGIFATNRQIERKQFPFPQKNLPQKPKVDRGSSKK